MSARTPRAAAPSLAQARPHDTLTQAAPRMPGSSVTVKPPSPPDLYIGYFRELYADTQPRARWTPGAVGNTMVR